MKYSRLLEKVSLFLKFAASPELFKLNTPSDRGRLGSDLWFGDNTAYSSNDLNNFAVIDNRIKQIVSNLNRNYGILDANDQSAAEFYLNHPKTQELIKYICDSYNKNFPKLNAYSVASLLEEQAESNGPSSNPIFILMHDLIHQVIESDFVQSIESQGVDEEGDELITLQDQVNEDLASSLSNFVGDGQGLFTYISDIFNRICRRKFSELQNSNQEEFAIFLRSCIEDCFRIIKHELRGNLNKVTDFFSEEYLKRVKPTSPKVKQLVDGILSKTKGEMLRQVDNVSNNFGRVNSRYFNFFELFSTKDIFNKYHQDIRESNVVEQSDSSALRNWMIGCLGKVRELLNYFENSFEEEFLSDEDEDEDEDEE